MSHTSRQGDLVSGRMRSQDKPHYRWIDWVRFITAFMVMVCHCRSGNWTAWDGLDAASKHVVGFLFFALTRPALELVIIFFVLSGFLVGTPAVQRAADAAFRPLSFAVARASRIYVPLIPCMLVSAVLTGAAGHELHWPDFFGCLAGLQGVWYHEFAGNSPLWSLAYENWFYILCCCAGTLWSSRGRCWLGPMMGLLVSFVVFVKLDATFLLCWLLGTVGGLAPAGGKLVPRIAAGVVAALGGFAVCQVSWLHERTGQLLRFDADDVTRMGCLIIAFGLAVLLPALAVMPVGRFGGLERLGAKLATFSYTLYLTHYPLLLLWAAFYTRKHAAFSTESIGVFGAKVGSCLVLAVVLFWAFESRTEAVRNWGQSMAGRLSGRRHVAGA